MEIIVCQHTLVSKSSQMRSLSLFRTVCLVLGFKTARLALSACRLCGGLYLLASVRWPLSAGLCLVASVRWPLSGGLCLVASVWWPLSGGLCLMASV